jgi:hypothetical protein
MNIYICRGIMDPLACRGTTILITWPILSGDLFIQA